MWVRSRGVVFLHLYARVPAQTFCIKGHPEVDMWGQPSGLVTVAYLLASTLDSKPLMGFGLYQVTL